MSAEDTLEGFLDTYDPRRERVVLDLEVQRSPTGDHPFIIVRHGAHVMVLSPLGLSDHLCLDVHPFVAGEEARAGVMGMEQGRRYTLHRDHADGGPTPGTSHAWPATALVAVILGEQEETP